MIRMPDGPLKHVGDFPLVVALHTDVDGEHHRQRDRRAGPICAADARVSRATPVGHAPRRVPRARRPSAARHGAAFAGPPFASAAFAAGDAGACARIDRSPPSWQASQRSSNGGIPPVRHARRSPTRRPEAAARTRWRPSSRCWAACCSTTRRSTASATSRRRRLLQRRAPAHLRAHRRARRRRQAGRRRHRLGVARLGAEARLRRRARLSRRAGAERADRGEHPPLRGDRPRALDPAPARGDGRRHRRLGVQPARPQREGDPRPGRGQGAAHRRAGRARRSSSSRRSARCWPASSSASRRSTTATIRPTSPACRPASPTSTG